MFGWTRIFPHDGNITRGKYAEYLKSLMWKCSAQLTNRPQLVFAGGGYGSGKTTALNFLASEGNLPLEMGHMFGVDLFKLLIPEYNLIKAVGDGRASLTVQSECQQMASDLCEELIEARRSFIWDSSMSDFEATKARIEQAKNEGYELTMIAVLTPLEIAIHQAMLRAKDTRRFPNPVALPKSHVEFRRRFNDYVPYFDEATVFVNQGSGKCFVVAEKESGTNSLAIYDQPMLLSALSASETT